MTVYKYFIKMILKNKIIIIIYISVFFFIGALLGRSKNVLEEGFVETKFNIGIIDYSQSELSKGILDYMGKRNNIVPILDDIDDIKEQIFLEVVNAVIIIPEDFVDKVLNKEKALNIIRDDRNMATTKIENMVNKYIIFAYGAYDNEKFDLNKIEKALSLEVEVNMVSKNDVHSNGDTWFLNYYRFLPYIILSVFTSCLGMVMSDFTQKEIVTRRKISAIKFLRYNFEIYLGQCSLAIFIIFVFILGSIVLRGKYIHEVDLMKYMVNIIVFSFSSLCLVFMINNITNNKNVLSGLSTVLSLGTSLISGVMVPQEFLSDKVIAIAKFFPSYYYVRVCETQINSFMDIRYEILMMLLFGVVFILLGLYISKIKNQAQ